MKVSIAIPFHWMKNWEYFLTRCLKSIERQSYKDYEVVLVKAGTMPITSNRAISSSKGDLIKVLYMDDYFAHEDSLKNIVEAFKDNTFWLVTGCIHNDGKSVGNAHVPRYNPEIYKGNNTIGSPSVLTMRRDTHKLFDENLSWLLDCDLYERLHETYGEPAYLDEANIVIGLHEGQTSNLMSPREKDKELYYITEKYEGE